MADLEVCGADGSGDVAVQADQAKVVDSFRDGWCAEIACVIPDEAREIDLWLVIVALCFEFGFSPDRVWGRSEETVVCEGNGEVNSVHKIERIQISDSLRIVSAFISPDI